MTKVLFLCTGNYYRSRFAEIYLSKLAQDHDLSWEIDSRGLRISPNNVGPLSPHTLDYCESLELPFNPERNPIPLSESDLEAAEHVIAVKETEHRPLMQEKFPEWENRIEYWEVHDLDCATPEESLPKLRTLVDALFDSLKSASTLSE